MQEIPKGAEIYLIPIKEGSIEGYTQVEEIPTIHWSDEDEAILPNGNRLKERLWFNQSNIDFMNLYGETLEEASDKMRKALARCLKYESLFPSNEGFAKLSDQIAKYFVPAET